MFRFLRVFLALRVENTFQKLNTMGGGGSEKYHVHFERPFTAVCIEFSWTGHFIRRRIDKVNSLNTS